MYVQPCFAEEQRARIKSHGLARLALYASGDCQAGGDPDLQMTHAFSFSTVFCLIKLWC